MKKQIYKFAFLSFLLILKNLVFGYFPILDDYIQYGSYSLYTKNYILFNVGTIYKRPAATVFDLFLWQKLGMNISAVIIAVMLVLSLFMLKEIFKIIKVNIGIFTFTFTLLCPLNFESTYWLSASSRIVSGVFFCALSLYIIAFTKRKIGIFAFWFFNFLSYLFYEQALIFSFVSAVFFLFFKNKKLIFIPFSNLIPTVGYYIIAAPSDRFSERGKIGIKFFPHIKSLAEIFFSVLPKMIFKSEYLIFAVILFVISMFVLYKFLTFNSSAQNRGIIFAAVVFVLPFAPYFILKNSYLSLRSVFFAVMSIGIFSDNIRISKRTAAALISLLISLFAVGSASEFFQYKAVCETDRTICRNLVNSGFIEDNKTYYLVGAKKMYIDINAPFAEHILNVTQSDWSLTGAVRFFAQNKNIRRIIPVSSESECTQNCEKIYIDDNLKIKKLK